MDEAKIKETPLTQHRGGPVRVCDRQLFCLNPSISYRVVRAKAATEKPTVGRYPTGSRPSCLVKERKETKREGARGRQVLRSEFALSALPVVRI